MKILDVYNKYNNFGRLLKFDYKELKPGEIDYFLTVTKDLLATKTAAHGGAIAGFMDAILGVSALSKAKESGKVVATIEFKINYLKPAYLGDQLKAEGKVISSGNRIISSEGKIFNQHNELIATGWGTFNAYPFEKSDMVEEVIGGN